MQLQGIGTGWMIPKTPNNDAAFNQLIGQMKTLEEVRPFMCPKSYGNTKKCESCDGFRTCTAGQRAVRLAAEEAGMNRKTEEAKVQKAIPVDATKDRELFRTACESGNAWNYLMTEYGMSEGSAREKLVFWIRTYPQISQEFGGKKRVMAKPKQVRIVKDEPEAQEESPETPEEAPQKPEAAIKERVRIVRDDARERCRIAVESGDPYQYLLDQGKNRHLTTNTICRWRKNYPDLMANVPYLPKDGTENSRRSVLSKLFYEECMAQEDPAAYYAEKRGVSRKSATANLGVMRKRYGAPEKEPEDEVSLADFLTEFDEIEEMPENMPSPEDDVEEFPEELIEEDDPFIADARKKMNALKKEKERLEAEISERQARILRIEGQQDALARMLAAFGEG